MPGETWRATHSYGLGGLGGDTVLGFILLILTISSAFVVKLMSLVMALGMLRGVQDTRVPMVIAVVSYWLVGLPISYYFGFTLAMEGVGIWLGLTVGLACACALMQVRFWTRYTRPA